MEESIHTISAAYQEKKQLRERLEALKEEEASAKQSVQEAQIRCQKENLDVRKFESNDFKQFWFKLRGQYEARVLENNEKSAEAMRALSDAETHAYDLGVERRMIEERLEGLADIDKRYEEALAKHIEHLDYSVHREEIIGMQQKISHDDYQIKLLEEAQDILALAKRKAEEVRDDLHRLAEDDGAGLHEDDNLQIKFISALSVVRIQLHQLRQILDGIDALEVEAIDIKDNLSVSSVDLFFAPDTPKVRAINIEKAEHEMRVLLDDLTRGADILPALLDELHKTQQMHQEQLETFINDTVV
ncbi:MAG: hypothetical protein Q4C56_08100 [Peptococcaceae bacterium]|nr:hypothetical protein [Peptococcaceae bacterium]